MRHLAKVKVRHRKPYHKTEKKTDRKKKYPYLSRAAQLVQNQGKARSADSPYSVMTDAYEETGAGAAKEAEIIRVTANSAIWQGYWTKRVYPVFPRILKTRTNSERGRDQ